MEFIADIHVHSCYSRATAKDLNLENLYIAAQIKGITVVGTGDFTHPAWFSEIEEKLEPAEEGLFKLKEEIARSCDQRVPEKRRSLVRFILSTEISNIYKKNERTRKNHNLVFMPDLESARKFSQKLSRIGNIVSDGRPILGLDARDLLEIVIETSDQGFLIPAHIWTPWFSLLGSKSGFDSVKECFEDLSSCIFAVETGLSSDPAMNWRVSNLDGLTLVSNSDAHSPSKLGREANLFDTRLSYSGIFEALRTGKNFCGTLEFYPEEGKYHLDGHRNCHVRLWPKKTTELNGICPVCGKNLTLGVLYRVEELADHETGRRPERHHPFYSLAPLCDVLSEIFKVGSGSKKVQNAHQKIISDIGSELDVLLKIPVDQLNRSAVPLLGEAVRRIREKELSIQPGYDGDYGKICIFEPGEQERLLGQRVLFSMAGLPVQKEASVSRENKTTASKVRAPKEKHAAPTRRFKSDHLNEEQRAAVECARGPMIIIAGPGTGKTHTLTRKIAYMIQEKGVPANNILAVTFTHQAAGEMKDRLRRLLSNDLELPLTGTFHSIAYQMIQDACPSFSLVEETDRKTLVREAMAQVENKEAAKGFESADRMLEALILAKQSLMGPEDALSDLFPEKACSMISAVYRNYENLLSLNRLMDYEDLVFKAVRRFEHEPDFVQTCRERFLYVFVDEYQDVNHAQYRFIQALCPENANISVIGDPDQAIYGFRGSDVRYFERFAKDYPSARIVRLERNYRSTQVILDASRQVIHPDGKDADLRLYSGIKGYPAIGILDSPSEKAEAAQVAGIIEKLVGGSGYDAVDFGKIDANENTLHMGFSDFAVLYRTGRQSRILEEIFNQRGIPCQVVSREKLFDDRRVRNLISLLKVVEGSAAYTDFDRLISERVVAVGSRIFGLFKRWAYCRQLRLNEALIKAKRFPIPDMTRKDQMRLCEGFEVLERMQNDMFGKVLEEKLNWLIRHLQGIQTNSDGFAEIFKRLLEISRSHARDVPGFLVHMGLQKDPDAFDGRAQKVALMTMHSAKGLEFPVVFVTGCESGLIPFDRSDVEEERRLFYVSMTRARERLYLSCAGRRRVNGAVVSRAPSPFLRRIETQLKQMVSLSGRKKAEPGPLQLNLF